MFKGEGVGFRVSRMTRLPTKRVRELLSMLGLLRGPYQWTWGGEFFSIVAKIVPHKQPWEADEA